MSWKSYFRCSLITTLNILLYAITFGHYIWLEGRVSGGKFRNWTRRYKYKPSNFAQPTTETEIIDLVKNSRHIRVFGGGHSFNASIKSEQTLISLDKYSGLISKDLANKQMTFKAGTRVRDVVKTLLADGLAFSGQPSHDAQSIAGILATDVHGTGRDWGFVSEFVTKLKIIDGRGTVLKCGPDEDLFKAAIGGVGAVGIISEVTVQAVDRFNVEQKTWITDLNDVEKKLDHLIQENEHLSLYLFPFTSKCQVNTWNRSDQKKSHLGELRKFIDISVEALLGAWFGNLLAYTNKLPILSDIGISLKQGSSLVLESNAAFKRSIYLLHQELEFAVPYEDTFSTCNHFIQLYEQLYQQEVVPYKIVEVRFTPSGHERTLIGPGQNRRTAWINLVINDSYGYENYFHTAEIALKQTNARPHLGKFSENFEQRDLEQRYQDNFFLFNQLRNNHDPEEKFSNPFTKRLFEKIQESTPVL